MGGASKWGGGGGCLLRAGLAAFGTAVHSVLKGGGVERWWLHFFRSLVLGLEQQLLVVLREL